MATLTDTWHFTYLDCWTMETWTLPNGVTIPLPPRKKYWPDRGAKITVSRFADYEKKTAWYNMTIMPIGHDFVTARNFLIGQGAESAAGKIGALMFSKVPRAAAGIVLGPVACGVLAGLATVLVPSQVATEKFWNGSCSEGPVHVVVTGWNV